MGPGLNLPSMPEITTTSKQKDFKVFSRTANTTNNSGQCSMFEGISMPVQISQRDWYGIDPKQPSIILPVAAIGGTVLVIIGLV